MLDIRFAPLLILSGIVSFFLKPDDVRLQTSSSAIFRIWWRAN
jgi:hypothetical protein